jgi:hypothetical protein
LADIYLCHTCSCHEILRMETPGQVAADRKAVQVGARTHSCPPPPPSHMQQLPRDKLASQLTSACAYDVSSAVNLSGTGPGEGTRAVRGRKCPGARGDLGGGRDCARRTQLPPPPVVSFVSLCAAAAAACDLFPWVRATHCEAAARRPGPARRRRPRPWRSSRSCTWLRGCARLGHAGGVERSCLGRAWLAACL